MKPNFYQTLTVLCLLQSKASRVSLIVLCSHIFGWSLQEAKENFQQLEKSCVLVDGRMIYHKDREVVETGDRVLPVEIYLNQCNDNDYLRKQIKRAMA